MKNQKSSKTVVVTGDITIDWNIAKIQRSESPTYEWNADDLTCAFCQPGGAAMLANLIKALGEEIGKSRQAYFDIRTAELPPRPNNPIDERFHHSYTLWTPFIFDERNLSNKRKVWRMQEFLGLHSAGTDMASPDDWRKVTDDPVYADLVVLDDADLGFRSNRDYWPQAILNNKTSPWILLKMAKPIAQGQLWEYLQRYHPDKLIAVMTVNDVRRYTDVQISRQISWERTAQDLLWELLYNTHLNILTRCLYVVVSFDTAGAMLLSRRPDNTLKAFLLFDPHVMEGEWGQNYKGHMIGYTTCLTAGIALELMLNSIAPDLPGGIQSGLTAMRSLHIEGYGDANTDLNQYPVAFPISKIAGKLANESNRFAIVQVRNPAQPISTRTTADANSTIQQFWTILEEQKSDSLEKVACKIVLESLEYALSNVPVRRFGTLLTVDRREIEALNSIGSLIREYSRRTQSNPLSIAVFGPPGAGKSFAIRQIANSVLPGQIIEMTFNLSQFGSPDGLLDAFHQIRDKVLTGKLPLVFWDEFDTLFQGQPLGWLRYFLSPMQDGEFQEGQLVHPIGKCIFVFAGSTSHSMESFSANIDEVNRRTMKLQDFISRIKGYLDIMGPNRRVNEKLPGSIQDPYYIIRRAIFLRTIIERKAPQLLRIEDGKKIVNIDEGLLRAFLLVSKYKHGTRSMETIVTTSQLADKTSYERSSLPVEAQLDLHVDGREFYALMYHLEPDEALLERLAEAAHEIFCDDLRAKGYTYGHQTQKDKRVHSSLKEYSELPEDEKEQNRNNVHNIPNKLQSVGYILLPTRGNETPSKFTSGEIEQLAEMEHERWMQQKFNSGWKYAQKTNKSKKQHKDLVSWHDLSHDEQEKDRVLVTGIPRILQKAGYSMVKLSQEPEKA